MVHWRSFVRGNQMLPSRGRRRRLFRRGGLLLMVGSLLPFATLAWPSAASAKGSAATGSPIEVAIETPINTPIVDLSQSVAGLQAAARAINAAGGIRGHRVVVHVCNDQVNPNTELQCARDAVNSGAVAMVGNFIGFSQSGVEAILQAGQTAELAAITNAAPQFQSPVDFPLFFIPMVLSACTSPALAKAAHETIKIANVLDQIPGAELTTNILSSSAAGQGGKSVQFVGPVVTGVTTTDLSPAVAQLATKGTNLVALDTLPTQVEATITSSIAAGKTWGYCGQDTVITGKQLIELGPSFSKLYEGTPLPPLSATNSYPELRKFSKDMRAELAAGDSAASLSSSNYKYVALDSWLGMQVFAQVARSIAGPVNHNSFLAALSKAKVNLGLVPPINFAHPIGSGQYPRTFNDKVFLIHWNPVKKQFELVHGGVIEHAFALSGLGK